MQKGFTSAFVDAELLRFCKLLKSWKPEETRKFIETSLEAGEVKTTGTDIDKLMPAVSRFGGGNRAAKKQGVIEKIKGFFEKYFGV